MLSEEWIYHLSFVNVCILPCGQCIITYDATHCSLEQMLYINYSTGGTFELIM